MKKPGLLLLLLLVVGCANQPKPSDPPPPPVKQESAPASDFALGGIGLGDTEEIVVKALVRVAEGKAGTAYPGMTVNVVTRAPL
ncbi:MAG: hypothetical protein JWN15_2759 [Firmicutes bacterium]|nr:hypothetical protein [Bacillota bacterium]